jgi:hypothetical protein
MNAFGIVLLVTKRLVPGIEVSHNEGRFVGVHGFKDELKDGFKRGWRSMGMNVDDTDTQAKVLIESDINKHNHSSLVGKSKVVYFFVGKSSIHVHHQTRRFVSEGMMMACVFTNF